MQAANLGAGRIDSRSALAGNVRRLRKKKGWTQEHLAGRCNLHKNHIGMIERAEIAATVDTLDILCRALDVRPAQLLDGRVPKR
jgi:transcriptional regulator with XRE-family HTH domain